MDDLRATRGLRALLAVTLAIVAGGLAGPSSASAQIAFGKSSLSGFSTARPTSLQFGPDKRLYVSDQGGQIKAYSVIRTGANDYRVTGTEAIDLVAQMPNRNDSGAIVAGVSVGEGSGPDTVAAAGNDNAAAGVNAGDLPFTGLDLGLVAGAGGLLIIGGLAMRRLRTE